MLGAQQLLDLLICLPAVTLDGQAGIGIVDIGGNDRDDLIFIIALQIRISLIKEAVLICSSLLDFLLWGIDVFYLRTGHCKIGVAVIVIAFLNLDITKGGVQIIPLLIHLHHIDGMIFLRVFNDLYQNNRIGDMQLIQQIFEAFGIPGTDCLFIQKYTEHILIVFFLVYIITAINDPVIQKLHSFVISLLCFRFL